MYTVQYVVFVFVCVLYTMFVCELLCLGVTYILCLCAYVKDCECLFVQCVCATRLWLCVLHLMYRNVCCPVW